MARSLKYEAIKAVVAKAGIKTVKASQQTKQTH